MAKQMDPKHDTVGDKTWRKLQDRALKANPELGRSGSSESVRGAKRGAANYAKREQN